MHDECNGSDVFGSDICTCRPYLVHGIEESVREAQNGGVGVIAYNRKEGRALGEVTKFLVYNARKRQEGGDSAATYFERTECVAGVQDARFQQLMPDVLHWLGIRRIDRLMSMSNMKYDAIVGSGIEVVERVPIPRGPRAARRAGGDRGQEGGGILHARGSSRSLGSRPGQRPRSRALLALNPDFHRDPATAIPDRSGMCDIASTETSGARCDGTPDPFLRDTRRPRSLLSAAAVRERAHRMLQLALDGQLDHFGSI